MREYLELITSNILNVLKLMNGILKWLDEIKNNSIRLKIGYSKIDISLYEFSQYLKCIHLQTQHAVWQRISKNKENQIADKQNLSLCIHILLCIAIKEKHENAQYPDTKSQDGIYAKFLDKIVTCLGKHFLMNNNNNNDINMNKEQELKPEPIQNNNEPSIILIFGDLVDKLPLWLLNCDKILQSQK